MSAAIIFFCHDLIVDALFEGQFGSPHFILESIIFVAVSCVLVIDVRDLIRMDVRLEHERSRNKALSGALAECISAQMDEWRMTRSEKEVA